MMNIIPKLLNSLKARLFISMLLLTLIVLPVLAIALSEAFEGHIKAALKNELTAYSYSILAVAEPNNGDLFLPEQQLENQFNVIDSGLYAFVVSNSSDTNQQRVATLKSNEVWRSESALGFDFSDLDFRQSRVGEISYFEQTINGVTYFVLEYAVSFADGELELPVTLFIIKDKTSFNQTVSSFNDEVILWLAVIFVVLLVVQLIWLYWTLKPLAFFRQELEQIKLGHSSEVKGKYPKELQQVTEQLNTLLHTEQSQRVRYRNALSDLAHSLKTPLAVIQSKIGKSHDVENEVFQINATIEHQLKRAQSAGESSWRLGCSVAETVNELVMALEKIYQSKQLTFHIDVSNNSVFKGDKADLTELLGNLLDNACKAASTNVSISATMEKSIIVFIVQDDGNGMTQAQIGRVMERGTRADTYEQGHGIGLAIVKDLVTSYKGSINIEHSVQYGGAKFTLSFNQ